MLTGADHVLRLRHAVVDVAAAASWLATLGFSESERGEGFRILDNGALSLRLETSPTAATVRLELASRDLAATAAGLLHLPDLSCLGPPEQPDPTRIEQTFRGPFGFELVAVRTLDLDEQGRQLPVATTLPWQPEAVELLQAVLRFVPLDFRRGALARAGSAAESRTLGRGALEVTVEDARLCLLTTTPYFQQDRLREELARLGFAPDGGP